MKGGTKPTPAKHNQTTQTDEMKGKRPDASHGGIG